MPPQVRDGARVVRPHPVDVLAHLAQRVWRERLEADKYALASAPVEKIERLLVVCDVEPELRDPPTLQWRDSAAERLEASDVHREIVVDEEEVLAPERLHLRHDVLDRARRVRAAVELAYRAEVAPEAAAARCLDEA